MVDDIIDHFDRLQKGGLLFMTDFKKAFDTLGWNFMFKTLSIEMFTLRIRQDLELKGYDLGFQQKPIKIVQYADDCIMLFSDINELCAVINILDEFGKVSGLKLNLSKCEGLWLGKDKKADNIRVVCLVLSGLTK